MKRKHKRLTVSAMTIRILTSSQLDDARGGAAVKPTPDKTCWSAIPCPDYSSPCEIA
jgi:hypothetical protein